MKVLKGWRFVGFSENIFVIEYNLYYFYINFLHMYYMSQTNSIDHLYLQSYNVILLSRTCLVESSFILVRFKWNNFVFSLQLWLSFFCQAFSRYYFSYFLFLIRFGVVEESLQSNHRLILRNGNQEKLRNEKR